MRVESVMGSPTRASVTRRAIAFAIAVLLHACGAPPPPREPVVQTEPEPVPVTPPPMTVEPTGRVEILWDTWGIPHIYAKDEVALLWAFAFAQMQSHGDLLLRLYGQARGRAAEYWGEDYLESDRWVRLNGIPARAHDWMSRQDPLMRAYIDAFVEGINAYARTYPDSISDDVEAVLPVTAEDVLAHSQRVLQYTFVVGTAGIDANVRAWQRRPAEPGGDAPAGSQPGAHSPFAAPAGASGEAGEFAVHSPFAAAAAASGPMGELGAGSNAWAIAPARAAGGRAMLLANPHLPWGDLFTWYEAQLVVPGLDAYGAALLGFPLPGIALNDVLGWTHTVNTIDGADLYELKLTAGGYAWDGGERAFQRGIDTLRVRQADGTIRNEPLSILTSVHGPVIAVRGDRALALRVAGLDRPNAVEQTWRMLRARSMAEFERALARLQLPMFNVIYADRDGHILYVFNGQVPRRPHGDAGYWAGIVPGDSSRTLWTGIHDYADLPRVADPPSGWLQNANDAPWTATLPMPLRAASFPAYMSPQLPLAFRPQRSMRMLVEDTSITFQELQAYKHSTRVESADHILEDVLLAARGFGTDNARRAAGVLAEWDRNTNAESRGAVLYEAFFTELRQRRWPGGSPFDVPWESSAPLSTPDGLSDAAGAAAALDAAAEQVLAKYGALDVAWGDVNRLRRGPLDLPASGGSGALGVFRVLDFEPSRTGASVAVGGDSFVAAIEFGPTPRAVGLLAYGNATRASSPHRTDQLALAAEQRLRPIWRTRAEVEAHLERRDAY